MKDVLFPATSSSSDIILVLWTSAWVHILICESANLQQEQVLVTSMPLESLESHSARRIANVP
jgi:hypothetical protein